MCFKTKNTLKNNRYHNVIHKLNPIRELTRLRRWVTQVDLAQPCKFFKKIFEILIFHIKKIKKQYIWIRAAVNNKV
jgi:hypothetical protein